MKQSDVIELATDRLIPLWTKERERQIKLKDWADGKHDKPYKPTEATREYEELQNKAVTPLIGLIVRVIRQGIEIVDYQPGIPELHDPLWAIWNANRMGGRQKRLWRSVLTGGIGYALALPGTNGPAIKLYSGKNMIAVYQDAEADEWPMFAAEGTKADASHYHFNIYDEACQYTLQMNADGGDVQFIEEKTHGTGVVPVVRYLADTDDEGNVTGEVEPLIPIQASVDQSKFDLLMTQSFASFKIRYASGMATPENEEEAARIKLILAQDRILVSDNPATKFGTLDGTELTGYIEAGKASKQELASVAQVSPKAIVGAQANTSNGAEAQSADEASTMRKIHDHTGSFGESNGQLNRLVGQIAGLEGAWDDYAGVTVFRDSAIRSLAQVADAIGKLADPKLGIPKEALWAMLPDVTPDTVRAWKKMDKSSPLGALVNGLYGDDADGA